MRRALRAGLRATLCAALCALACGKTRLGQARSHAQVTPAALDFGSAPVLFPVSRALAVSNTGNVPLSATLVRVDGAGAAAWSAEAHGRALSIPPGETETLPVVFRAPDRARYAATLVVATDDPDQPEIDVPLAGEGATAGAISVTPEALVFGRVGEGQAQALPLAIASSGQADLYLSALGFEDGTPAAFGLVGSAQAPAVLARGAQAQLSVRFAPTPDTGGAAGALVIASSDPLRPSVTVPLSAQINRAPLALARGGTGGAVPRAGSLETGVGATVLLDATASRDPDGDLPLSYSWRLAERPAGSAAALGSATDARTVVTLDVAGTYAVELVAFDATGLPSFAPSRLDLRAAPPEELVVELVWDKVPPDLDLHLVRAGAAFESANDCFWANAAPTWFAGGLDFNPRHSGDQLVGYGPETVRWKTPAPGRYTVVVAYKQDHGAADPTTAATVRIFSFGVLAAELRQTLQRQGELWIAGTIDWPTGHVAAGEAPPEAAR